VIDPEATPAPRRALLSGWGRAAFTSCELIEVDAEHLAAAIKELPARGGIARGLGRSYGDPAQCAGGRVLRLVPSGDEITIDPAAGTATVGAGVSIDELLRVLVPRGWFVPVTPGTRYVTIGGAIASDIHGKNHHQTDTFGGSFGNHVVSLRLMLADGTLVEVGRGARKPAWAADVLAATDRGAAGPTAPPQGLFLVEVKYPDHIYISQPPP